MMKKMFIALALAGMGIVAQAQDIKVKEERT